MYILVVRVKLGTKMLTTCRLRLSECDIMYSCQCKRTFRWKTAPTDILSFESPAPS